MTDLQKALNIKRSSRIRYWACILCTVMCGIVHGEPSKEDTGQEEQILAFANLIAQADKIVIRDGGFNCCSSIDKQKVLFVVTDKDEIETVRNNIRFAKDAPRGMCMCCGGPGMDWYKGNGRMLTAFQHGVAIRWSGFAAPRKPFRKRDAYGDFTLTEESQAWLKEWFKSHGLEDLENYGSPKR